MRFQRIWFRRPCRRPSTGRLSRAAEDEAAAAAAKAAKSSDAKASKESASDSAGTESKARNGEADAEGQGSGEQLRQPNGTTLTVHTTRNYPYAVTTYNLTVDDFHTYYVLAGATPVLVHNCDVGTQVAHASTDLSRATVMQRLLDNNRGNLYGAARMNDGTVIVAHSNDAGHAEEHILNIAQGRGYSPTDITDMYTEYGMCPRCQGPKGKRAVLPQLSGDVNLTYSIPFANPATRVDARKKLASIVSGIFSG
ncbi:nucleic acid/nucleotide deaminase domain-containing protein [Streptomyces sp. NPDC020858]|uniref:nucleic acid/nucleotide deaminase domain-containing protein n=1 Tax=Streptomyces sp. NPDC020858 TaxID=3365097 RepID=UPI0037A277B6